MGASLALPLKWRGPRLHGSSIWRCRSGEILWSRIVMLPSCSLYAATWRRQIPRSLALAARGSASRRSIIASLWGLFRDHSAAMAPSPRFSQALTWPRFWGSAARKYFRCSKP